MRESIEKYIKELRHTTTVAGLNYEVWWVYKSNDTRQKYLASMNNYSIFFETSIHAHFVALLMGLYRLYETRGDTYNIPMLIEKLKAQDSFSKEVLEGVKKIYKEEAKPLWVKVSILRNKAFCHRSNVHTTQEIFKEAEVRPDELRDLVEVTKKLMNRITGEWDQSTHSFNLGSRESLIDLLEDLNKLHQS